MIALVPNLSDETLAEVAEGYTADYIRDLIAKQTVKIRDLKDQLAETSRQLSRTETELLEVKERLAREGAMRPSLEVLQRMANGVDPFDHNRFKCAVEALPFETPKLSMSTSQNLNMSANVGIAARLQNNINQLRVIEGGGGERPSPAEEPPPE